MNGLGAYEWRSDSHPADHINELEKQLAMANELLDMQHALILKLRGENATFGKSSCTTPEYKFEQEVTNIKFRAALDAMKGAPNEPTTTD